MNFGPYQAVVVKEHDGDTVSLDVHLAKRRLAVPVAAPVDLGFNVQLRHDGVWLADQSVRTFGDNAAELSTADGKAALAYLAEVMPIGTQVTLLSEGWDKYGGRCDGTITLPDGTDLVQKMIAAGYAAAWNGLGVKPVPTPY
jgi:endonuclease YncB( thermonuclease family)